MKIEINKTDVVLRMDDLGRIALPAGYREKVGIREGDLLNIYLSENGITFIKYDKNADKVEIAKKLLDDNKSSLKKYAARFVIDGSDTVTCECIIDGQRSTGIAKCDPKDTFNIYIGMAYAFCRSTGIPPEHVF